MTHLPESQLKLCSFLQLRNGISEQSLIDFFNAIDADEKLLGFARVAENLQKILPYLRSLDSVFVYWPEDKIDEWITICKNIVSAKDNIERLIPTISATQAGRFGPFRGTGVIPNHPLYAALWTCLEAQSSSKIITVFWILQAQVLNANFVLKKRAKMGGWKSYDSILSLISQAIRRIGWDEDSREILEYLPSTPCSVEHYHRKITSLLPLKESQKPKKHTIVEKQAINFERVLAFVLLERSGRAEKFRGKWRKKIRLPAKRRTVSFPGRDGSTQKYYWVTNSNASELAQDESLDNGCALDELYSGPEMVAELSFLSPEQVGRVSFVEQIMRTKNRLRHIASSNQDLSYAWNRLSVNEVINFLDHLYQSSYVGFKSRWTVLETLEVTTYAAVMFWTSSGSKRASKMRLCSNVDRMPAKLSTRSPLYYCINEHCWAIKNPDLPNRRKGESAWAKAVEPVDDVLLVPASPLCQKIMDKWVGQRSRIAERFGHVPLFKTSQQTLDRRLQKSLKDIGGERRLTAKRIQSYLFNLVAEISGDPADASLLFGRAPSGGYVTPLYYYAPRTADLRKLYEQACCSFEHVFVAEGDDDADDDDASTVDIDNLQTSNRTGSQICPTPESVALLVQDLRARMSYYRNNKLNVHLLADFHNLYTCYCIMMIGFATGYRAVTDPIHDFTDIDWQSGFLVISDKDNDDSYNTHIVWLPLVCRDQITAYLNHRRYLAQRLSWINKESAAVLGNSSDAETMVWHVRHNRNSQEGNRPTSPFFFFLKTEDYSLERVRPTSLAAQMDWCYELPLNANRHYLRTHLRESGVAGEMVDALLGHWERGKEPFGCYSSLSPCLLRSAVEPPLTQLLDTAGWRCVKGLSDG